MRPDLSIADLIDRYLQNSLEENDRFEFEKKLAGSEELKKELELTKVAHTLLLRNKLWEAGSIARGINAEQKSKVSNVKKWVGMGAVIVLVAGIGYTISQHREEEQQNIIIPAGGKAVLPAAEKIISVNEPDYESKSSEAVKRKDGRQEQHGGVFKTDTANIHTQKIDDIPVPPATVLPVEEIAVPEITKILQTADSVAEEDACSKINITAHVHTESSCINANTGRVSISGFKGGLEPYYYKMLNSAGQELNSSSLSAGVYSAVITDSRKCTSAVAEIIVKEVLCEKDFEINPYNGEIWELGTASVSAILTVFNKTETIYYYKQYAAGEKIQWNGFSNKGELSIGYFLFILKYQDGKTLEGSFTIVK